MAHNHGRVAALVFFYQPEGFEPAWSQTDLAQSAREIPGVSVIFDRDNREARRFGAKTSGYTMLFDRSGKLLFSGGITAARGHIGDNLGCDTLATILQGGHSQTSQTQVFGCPLAEADESQ